MNKPLHNHEQTSHTLISLHRLNTGSASFYVNGNVTSYHMFTSVILTLDVCYLNVSCWWIRYTLRDTDRLSCVFLSDSRLSPHTLLTALSVFINTDDQLTPSQLSLCLCLSVLPLSICPVSISPLSVHLSVLCPSVHLSVCPSVLHLSIYVSICPSTVFAFVP